jgi:hypothetical protein
MMKRYQDCKNWGCKLCDLTVETKKDDWTIYPRAEEDMKKLLLICEKCSNYEKDTEFFSKISRDTRYQIELGSDDP